jgi:flagellum-specific peptidoglycan hydrolase FlgJ
MATELAAAVTHVQPADMLVAMRDAWTSELRSTPRQSAICTLVAQWALETGGGRSCVAFNVGNFKASAGGAYDFCYFTTTERVSVAAAQEEIIQYRELCSWDGSVDEAGLATLTVRPRHPWCCFRAYPTLVAGCEDYLHTMYTRFAPAWTAAYDGNPEAFAKALGALHYYTSDPAAYAAGCLRWFRTLMAEPWPVPPT